MVGYGGPTYASINHDYDMIPGMPRGKESLFMRGQRRRMNVVAIILSLLLPWTFFAVVFCVLNSSYHYKQPFFVSSVVSLGVMALVVVGFFAASTVKRKFEGDPTREPNWYVFIFVTCCLMFVIALVTGELNYATNLQPYFDLMNLNMYQNVDPSRMRGQQLLDAGRIVFAEGTRLDIAKSMGFRNQKLFCVAPITKGTGNGTLATYDFWAVGMDCCSGLKADFHCRDYNNMNSKGGLRLMKDHERAFYRLAVQQAEATYNIKAVHPLFFEWMQDPIEEANRWQELGYRNFQIGLFAAFVLQCFLVACAAISFSKLGHL